jgi:CHAD domain-containing protein
MGNIYILSPDILCANKNLPPDKMSGRSNVLLDKTMQTYNNYFAWKDKCLAKTKYSRIFISFSRTIDKEKFSYLFEHDVFGWSC